MKIPEDYLYKILIKAFQIVELRIMMNITDNLKIMISPISNLSSSLTKFFSFSKI